MNIKDWSNEYSFCHQMIITWPRCSSIICSNWRNETNLKCEHKREQPRRRVVDSIQQLWTCRLFALLSTFEWLRLTRLVFVFFIFRRWTEHKHAVNSSSQALQFYGLYNVLRCMKCRCGLAMRILSLSVHPSVSQTRALWQNGRKIGPDFYIIRKII